jgi:membrane-associated protease RseP (regulator of RpoE activity)
MYNPTMKTLLVRTTSALAFVIMTSFVSGCSSTKEPKPEVMHQRGWIGGKYEVVGQPRHLLGIRLAASVPMPHDPAYTNRTGLLITTLGTNTPAHQAGLSEGDLIVELNHQPITTMAKFRKIVDAAPPGSPLSVTAWHNGQTFDGNLSIGRESYVNNGTFGFWLPFYKGNDLGRLDLWPNPGFSLGFVLGFEPCDKRVELNTPKGDYHRAVTGQPYTLTENDWNAWLVVFSLSRGKSIRSQEIVAATDSPPLPAK